MEENKVSQETQIEDTQSKEPVAADNSQEETSKSVQENITQSQNSGQAEKSAPQEELILGKFKSVDDLAKAYSELQKHQGKNSEELGNLRKELSGYNEIKNFTEFLTEYQNSIIPVIKRDKELYNTPEYFQNPVFSEIYREALVTFGDNLDTDRLVNLLEKYVEGRIQAHVQKESAKDETQKVLNSMNYSKNPKASFTPPKKSLDEMTENEFRESIRGLI